MGKKSTETFKQDRLEYRMRTATARSIPKHLRFKPDHEYIRKATEEYLKNGGTITIIKMDKDTEVGKVTIQDIIDSLIEKDN